MVYILDFIDFISFVDIFIFTRRGQVSSSTVLLSSSEVHLKITINSCDC